MRIASLIKGWVLFSFGLCLPIAAQAAAEPVYVPLMIKVKATLDWEGGHSTQYVNPSTANVTATFDGDPAPPAVVGTFGSNNALSFPSQILPIEMGRESVLTISATNSTANSVTLTPPPGYTILIDGLARKTKGVGGSGILKVRVLPALDSTAAPAGTATGLTPGQVKWGVSLGSEKNGQSIGWLWMIGAGVSDWDTFFKPTNLYFEQDSEELAVHKISVDGVSNIKRQIRTNEAFVDLISGNTPAETNVPGLSAGAEFEIRFYHPSSMTASGSLRKPLTNKHPFVIYRVIKVANGPGEPASTKRMRIEKQVCALGDSPAPVILRTEHTTLVRTGASLSSYTWTATDWTLANASPLTEAVAVWDSIPGITDGHREVSEVRDLANGGTVVARMSTDHVATLPGLARIPVMTVAAPGAADSVTSSVAYYADAMANGSPDPAKRYRRGFPQISSSTGGAWSAVTYIDPDNREPSIPNGDKDEWLGLVDTSFSPWLDTAAPALATNVEPAISTGIVATRMDYTKDIFGYPSRVTLVETYRDSINPTYPSTNRISRRTTDYSGTSQDGRSAILAESKDYYGSGTNDYLPSYRIYFREDDLTSFRRSQVNTEVSPTGAKVSYIRQRGDLIPAAPDAPMGFNGGSDKESSRIGVITGAETASADTEATAMTTYESYGIRPTFLLPGRSTLSFTYRDAYARVVRTESYLRTTSATWQLVAWENYTYNTRNQLTLRTASNGDTHELFYEVELAGVTYDGGEYLTREVDAMGVETTYDYDVAGRMWRSTRSEFGDLPALVTESVYDAADRVVEQRTFAADAPGLKSATTRVYDLAGRVTSEKSSGSPAVTTTYNPAARTTTVTNTATGATKINEAYLDGQPKSVTGTAVIAERYAYAIETDGRRRTEATSGPVGSNRTVKSWSDWLGRNTSSQRPAPPGITGPLVSETFYSATTGLPIRGTSPGSAPTLTTYDVVGEPKLTGLDAEINGSLASAPSGSLEPTSTRDRITGTRKSVVFSDSAWWATSESYTYATAGSATETILGKSWTRLTGLTGGLVGETRSWDAEGNLTRRTVERNRVTRTVTTRTWLPGIAAPQTDIAVDGLATESTAPDGLRATTTYDGLRRPYISSTSRPDGVAPADMRSVTTQYQSDGLGTEATSLVWKVTDSENRTIIYEKQDAARITTITNPDGKYVTQLYNLRGQVTHVYGTATSPVKYEYDTDYGHRTEQYTYRDTVSAYISDTAFPADGDAKTDRVVWTYDDDTGLLLEKTDPLNRFVKYTYDAAGRIATRQWARFLADGTTPLNATPTYDLATGDLLSTEYNDGVTPTVSTTYDRLGRPQTITDATGTRTFVRDTAKPWRTNAEQLPAFYGSGRQLSWLYEESSGTSGGNGYVLGRSKGFRFGTAAQPDALLEQTFARSDIGRLSGIASTHSAASTRNFAYTYTPNSRLVNTLTAAGTGYSLTRQWDPIRGLLTQIETKSGTHTLAKYDYGYHSKLSQRQTATQTGEAFAADATDPAQTTTTYAYNERGEVESALTGVGNTSTAPAALIPGRKFAFRYDLAGNRVKSSHQNDISDVAGETGGPATAKYVVGKGNQLTQRDNPVASVSGVIANTATVMAVDQAPLTAADRQGHHWQRDVTSSEKAAQAVVKDDGGTVNEYPRNARSLVTLASLLGAGTGGADLTAFDQRLLVMNPRDEQFLYDRDGNLRRDGTWDYTWDAENRLVSMVTHDWLADQERKLLEFTYDYQGRRVAKRVQTWPVGASGYLPATETRYLYDGWNLIAEFETTSATPFALRRSFTWGLDLIGSLTASGGVGALVQITDHADGQSYLPGYDGNGNVAVLVRASDGYRAAAYEYGPYGEVLRSEGTYAAQNTFRFSTKFTDVESGLVYYGMRYYDARNGRFINRDPIEERGGLNLYGFCGNDGVNRYDVLGMSWLSKAWKSIKKFVKKWWKPIVAIAASILTYGVASGWAAGWIAGTSLAGTTAGSVAAGAIAGGISGFAGGALGGALNGGGIGDILRSGLIGGLTGAALGGLGGYLRGPSWSTVPMETQGRMAGVMARGDYIQRLIDNGPLYASNDMGLNFALSAGATVGQSAPSVLTGGVAATTSGAITAGISGGLGTAWEATKRFLGGDPNGGFLGTSLTPGEFSFSAAMGAQEGAVGYLNGMTFGLSGTGGFDVNGSGFQLGRSMGRAAIAVEAGLLSAGAFLAPGSTAVFYSGSVGGVPAWQVANASGATIMQTAGGQITNVLVNTVTKIGYATNNPFLAYQAQQVGWGAASAAYATSNGLFASRIAYVGNHAAGHWTAVERPILEWLGRY